MSVDWFPLEALKENLTCISLLVSGEGFDMWLSLVGASLVAQRLKSPPAMWETRVRSLGSGRSPGEGNGNLLQYSCLENPMDGEVHGVAKSRTRLSDLTFHFRMGI